VNQAVFVIDDDEGVRDSLTFLLRTAGFTSRSFASARAFLDQLHKDHEGCIVTDVRMPGMDGMALVKNLAEIGCVMPIIVITGHADVPLAVQAMKAGVADFIEKPLDGDALLRSVRLCLKDAEALNARETRKALIEGRRATLTERESQVLKLVVDGLSNKEVALALGISPRTVEIHRANVMSKMSAAGLSELVRMVLTSDAA